MKRILKYFVPIWVLCSVCLALSGFATGLVSQRLIDSCDLADPPVEKYHAAYAYKGNVVLEYTVQDRHDRRFQRFSDRHWATLHLEELANPLFKGDYSIQRNLLPDPHREKLTPIPIVDLRDHVAAASDGHIKSAAFSAFLKKQSTDKLPQVFVCMKCGTQLYIRYRNPKTGEIGTYTMEPYDVFIPASRYPKLLLLYPLAVLGDIVTFPLLLLVPRWN